MDMTDDRDIGFAQSPRRKKSLGQHFLNSGRTVGRIVDALRLEPGLVVVEIGPGRGALTRELAGRGAGLVLVEMDAELVPLLGRSFPDARIVLADAGEVDTGTLVPTDGRAVAVGNLPYNAGGRILFNLLTGTAGFERLVLMFQKEVADRFCAAPGDRDFGAASLLVSLMSETRYLFDVPPSRFIPPPKVMSGVVLFTPRQIGPDRRFVRSPEFSGFVHALFAQPRKTVANSMMDGLRIDRQTAERLLAEAGVDPRCRPNHLTPASAVAMYLARADLPATDPSAL